jgi:hypothetical protein
MNNSTSYINDVNTRAVQLLQESRHKEAIVWLRRGVKFAVARVAETNSTDCAPLVPFTFEAHQQSMPDIEGDEGLTYTVAIPEVHDSMSVSPENVFVVFNRAFTYDKHGVLNSSANCAQGTEILLYNMGIAYHHLGIQENNTVALKKSLYTYQMAYKVLLSQNWCDDACSCLVMLALCNNMSHIHGHLSNLKAARGLWDLLTEVLACVSIVDSSDDVGDYGFFAVEAMLFGGRNLELQFAPAA